MRFRAIANPARGGPQRPPPMGDRVNRLENFMKLVYIILILSYLVDFSSPEGWYLFQKVTIVQNDLKNI